MSALGWLVLQNVSIVSAIAITAALTGEWWSLFLLPFMHSLTIQPVRIIHTEDDDD